jgi:hypothetical protein
MTSVLPTILLLSGQYLLFLLIEIVIAVVLFVSEHRRSEYTFIK